MKKIKKCLIILIIIMLIPMSSYAELESDVIYKLNDPNNIQLTNLEIELQDLADDVKTFDESMAEKDLLLSTDNTGETSTQIYYENEEDRLEQIMRVDMDFKGLTLPAPTNAVFLMDQSGSMNMAASRKSYASNVSPCMNEEHYTRLYIKINGVNYVYYFNAQEEGLTDSWINIYADLRKHIIEEAIAQGIATSSDSISFSSAFNTYTAPEKNHYRPSGINEITDQTKFFEIDASANIYTPSEEEKKYFSKIDLGFLELEDTSVTEYYSPIEWYNTAGAPTTPDWREVGSDEYFNYLNENSLCYDRMSVSKILFEELSNIAVSENDDNKIGYIKYAQAVRETKDLEHENFSGTNFAEMRGYAGTNWTDSYIEAEKMFQNEEYGQNMAIMVTDGKPYQGATTKEGVKSVVDRIASENNAIMMFVGISLNEGNMETYSEAASTSDSEGKNLAFNGKSLDDFKAIIDYLEKILTSASKMDTQIGDMLDLEISTKHPITVEYIYNHEGEDIRETKTYGTLKEAAEIGLMYDSTTKTISWDMHKIGIHSVRLSYYEKIDVENINWEEIENGGSITGMTNKDANINYIDQTGAIKDLPSNEAGNFVLENTSYLTIENHTTTPYEVKSGEQIDYVITIKNNGTLDANNLVVKQKIPDNTIFKSTDLGVYNKDTNDITFTIPELKANESIELRYSATANGYNVIIQSSAQLGVSTNLTTFDANNWPILSAVVLEHKTSEQIIVEDSNENIEDFIDKFIPLPNTGYFDGEDFDAGNLITRIIYTTILLGIIYGMLRKKDKKK